MDNLILKYGLTSSRFQYLLTIFFFLSKLMLKRKCFTVIGCGKKYYKFSCFFKYGIVIDKIAKNLSVVFYRENIPKCRIIRDFNDRLNS